MSEKWGLVAEFSNPSGEDAYTFYDEVTFGSYEEALEAVNEEYGELLVAAAIIDNKNEADLQGFTFDDLAPYLIEEEQGLS
jgi:hypothetical protein